MSTHNIPFNIQKKTSLNYPKSARDGMFSFRFKNEFETAVVNEPSMFEPLKFYCIFFHQTAEKAMSVNWYTFRGSHFNFLPPFSKEGPSQGFWGAGIKRPFIFRELGGKLLTLLHLEGPKLF